MDPKIAVADGAAAWEMETKGRFLSEDGRRRLYEQTYDLVFAALIAFEERMRPLLAPDPSKN